MTAFVNMYDSFKNSFKEIKTKKINDVIYERSPCI